MRILTIAEDKSPDRDEQIEHARNVFYRGFVAEEIAAFTRSTRVLDTSGERHHGFLDADDLANWQARYEAPATARFRDLVVAKPGTWTQGPVFLQQLGMLDELRIAETASSSSEFVHLNVEVAKLAYADREAYYGDPDFEDVPLRQLLSKEYLGQRARTISAKASSAFAYGIVPDWTFHEQRQEWFSRAFTSSTDDRRQAIRSPFNEGQIRSDTCHLNVADSGGNVIAATVSGGFVQCSPLIPALGFPLGTRAQMFRLEKSSPNVIRPGKRPRTTLSPTLILKDDVPLMSFGTRGGDQQDQWSVALLLRLLSDTPNLQAAIDLPLFHSEHLVSSYHPFPFRRLRVCVESRHSKALIDNLTERGHQVAVKGPWEFGDLNLISMAGGVLRAAASPRGMRAYAIGR